MAQQWRKVIVSGSQAHLAGITGSLLTDERLVFTNSGSGGALTTDDTLQYRDSGPSEVGMVLSGSIFSGSFVGDGSRLTGLVTELTFSSSNNGSADELDLKDDVLGLTGSNGAWAIVGNNGIEITLSGSTSITAVTASTLVNERMVFSVSGALTTDNTLQYRDSGPSEEGMVLSGSIFSGSFVGDGSGLTGLVTELKLSSSNNGTSDELDLKLDTLAFTGSNGVFPSIGANGVELKLTGSFSVEEVKTDRLIVTSSTLLSGSTEITGTLSWQNHIFPTGTYTDAPGQVMATDLSGNFQWRDITLGSGSTTKQAFSASSFNFNHYLDEYFPVVNFYERSTNRIIEPSEIQALNQNTLNVTFTEIVEGTAVAVVGGVAPKVASTIHADTASYINPLTQSVYIQGDVVDMTQVGAISGSVFSGSFVGDGSGLTGIVTSLVVTASNFEGRDTSGSLDLKNGGLIVSGTKNEVDVSFVGGTLNIGLPNDVVVKGNLTVQGDVTSIDSVNLKIEDRWALLASGSWSAGTPIDGGIVVEGQGSSGTGYAFGIDASAKRWSLQTGFGDNSTGSMDPDSYMTTTQFGVEADQPSTPAYGGTANGYGNIWVSTDTEEIFIWA